MYKHYKANDVDKMAAVGLKALTDLARVRLKTCWEKMSLSDKCAAARSLVYMEQVAKNPKLYFSRENTEAAWHQRALDYAQQKKLHDLSGAYYIVQDPTGIVWHNARYSFFNGNGADYYNFCKSVQQWMYDNNSQTYATQIVDNATKYQNMLATESASCFMRPFVKMKQAFRQK